MTLTRHLHPGCDDCLRLMEYVAELEKDKDAIRRITIEACAQVVDPKDGIHNLQVRKHIAAQVRALALIDAARDAGAKEG